ncbi:MAG: NAD(P)-dependent oxidoreductase [Maricaulaceae bacterium]
MEKGSVRMAVIGFLGLGVMGFPMAGHLAAAGHQVRVWNRTPAKAHAWADQHPGQAKDTIAEAAGGADFVMACVGDDPDLYAVARPALAALGAGAVFVDHTTASPEASRTLAAEAQARGISFLDAPVSGGQAGAEAGRLAVMAGGEAEAFARAEAIMAAYAKTMRLLGPSGAGQLTKSVNQICIAGVVQGLAEAVHFAKAAGLDPDAVFDTLAGGAAQSWQMENRAQTMARGDYDFGFAVDWMRKDLRIALAAAREMGAQLPLTALVDQFYAEVQAMGGGRWDTSSLAARLDPPAGS